MTAAVPGDDDDDDAPRTSKAKKEVAHATIEVRVAALCTPPAI